MFRHPLYHAPLSKEVRETSAAFQGTGGRNQISWQLQVSPRVAWVGGLGPMVNPRP